MGLIWLIMTLYFFSFGACYLNIRARRAQRAGLGLTASAEKNTATTNCLDPLLLGSIV
jgi:hypothetical protein